MKVSYHPPEPNVAEIGEGGVGYSIIVGWIGDHVGDRLVRERDRGGRTMPNGTGTEPMGDFSLQYLGHLLQGVFKPAY
ncbi:MAG: hypothetical protein QXG08_04620 [Candidatus Methanomethyliaceae archaeon]